MKCKGCGKPIDILKDKNCPRCFMKVDETIRAAGAGEGKALIAALWVMGGAAGMMGLFVGIVMNVEILGLRASGLERLAAFIIPVFIGIFAGFLMIGLAQHLANQQRVLEALGKK